MAKITSKAADAIENAFIAKRIDLGWKNIERLSSMVDSAPLTKELAESRNNSKEVKVFKDEYFGKVMPNEPVGY